MRWMVVLAGATVLGMAAAASPRLPVPGPVPGRTDAEPDVPACRAGRLHLAEVDEVLAVLNEIRRLHGLGEVVWAPELEETAQQAALMMAANRRLSHRPGAGWRCHTAAGAQGAAISNLHLGLGSGTAPAPDSGAVVVGFLTDVHNRATGELGHRRWLLDPFLQRVAFGRVTWRDDGAWVDAAALAVVPPATAGDAAVPAWGRASRDHLAWPEGDYPARYFDPRAWLSFSAVVDLQERAANLAVDYGEVSVRLRRADGQELPVLQLRSSHAMVGLPNHLQFRVPGIEPGVEHEALIEGVRVDGLRKDFRYRFRIVP